MNIFFGVIVFKMVEGGGGEGGSEEEGVCLNGVGYEEESDKIFIHLF